jgi:rubrerythrin
MFEFGIIQGEKPVLKELTDFREVKEFNLKFKCETCGYEHDNHYYCPKCANVHEDMYNAFFM